MAKNGRAARIGLAEAQNWRCAFCAGQMRLELGFPDSATRDHLKPRRRGGGHETDNTVACCAACNVAKGSRFDPWVFRRLRRRHMEAWPAGSSPPRSVLRALALYEQDAAERRIARYPLMSPYYLKGSGPPKAIKPADTSPVCRMPHGPLVNHQNG